VKVSDSEIIRSIPELAQKTGVFVEPAAAATLAGFKRMIADGRVKSDERVLLMLTGNGLKDVETARRSVKEPLRVRPDVDIADLGLQIADQAG
jgi:threonine synthase